MRTPLEKWAQVLSHPPLRNSLFADMKESTPVTFRDVEEDSGIPRTFGNYTSGNR
jgi:hypothetical protein